ncbi:S-adenosyl-L-methionine-dependent methyltransferase [Pilobolus umbonatus]|nr:S-adenosyl-L-methionine-dependent methyltransferase [Pilobolus umbonatus]
MFFSSLLAFFKRKGTRSIHEQHSSSSPLYSQSSEGRNFHIVEGRRFNNDDDVRYILPNDDTEADRLHLQHWALKLAFRCNYLAPIKKSLEQGIHVIDSGCGPATWAFEMANDYPNSQFTGVDISFVFPETIRPPNVDFQICNIAKELPFKSDSIGYVHQRLLVAGLNRSEFEASLKEAFRVLKPGGYIELGEPNIGAYEKSGPTMAKISEKMNAMLRSRGMIPDLVNHLEGFLKDVGFINIHQEKKLIPINHSGKVGELWWQDSVESMRSFKPIMARDNPALQDTETFEGFIKKMGEECIEYSAYISFGIAYAQKPLAM